MLLHLDFSNEIPIYMQIRNQIVIGIANGDLRCGEKLPTIRSMANEAGINMMTVSKAYQLLKSEGYIETDRRSGAIVRGLMKQSTEMEEKVKDELRVIAAQVKLSGITKEEFTAACAEVYSACEIKADDLNARRRDNYDFQEEQAEKEGDRDE